MLFFLFVSFLLNPIHSSTSGIRFLWWWLLVYQSCRCCCIRLFIVCVFFFVSAQYKRGRNRGKKIVTARTYHLNDTRHLTGWSNYDFSPAYVHVRAICVWFKLEHVLHIIHFFFFISLQRNKTKGTNAQERKRKINELVHNATMNETRTQTKLLRRISQHLTFDYLKKNRRNK